MLILLVVTALVAFLLWVAWRGRTSVLTIAAGPDNLTVSRRRLIGDQAIKLAYDQIGDITYGGDTGQASQHCLIRHAPHRKLKLLTGHREDEIIWLIALLRWACRLDDAPE